MATKKATKKATRPKSNTGKLPSKKDKKKITIKAGNSGKKPQAPKTQTKKAAKPAAKKVLSSKKNVKSATRKAMPVKKAAKPAAKKALPSKKNVKSATRKIVPAKKAAFSKTKTRPQPALKKTKAGSTPLSVKKSKTPFSPSKIILKAKPATPARPNAAKGAIKVIGQVPHGKKQPVKNPKKLVYKKLNLSMYMNEEMYSGKSMEELNPTLEKYAHIKSEAQKKDIPIEDKLRALYELQQIDSKIDQIKVVRGELPAEVADLEDDIAGLSIRVKKAEEDIAQLNDQIMKRKQSIKDSQALIKKYDAQKSKVKNNREYDSLTKEIEFQTLDIQLSEKKIKEITFEIEEKKKMFDDTLLVFEEKKRDLEAKKSELNSITAETEKEEKELIARSQKASHIIEGQLLNAYRRLRANATNGLAVVNIQRDSCGGCFNKIPPQRQLEIKQHKKLIVCEHCGRIMTDFSEKE